jgi:hypothetical protein
MYVTPQIQIPRPSGVTASGSWRERDLRLIRNRRLRAAPNLVSAAEWLAERPPVIDRVGGEAADKRLDVLTLPRSAVLVEPVVERVEGHQ